MPSFSSAFIVRDRREVELAAGKAKAGTLFLCTNTETLLCCRAKDHPALLLDEDLIAEEFKPINAWAFRQTLNFILKFQDEKKSWIFLESNFMYVCALFVQVLMSVLVFEKLKKDHNIGRLSMFESKNPLLAETYSEYRRLFQPSLEVVLLPKLAGQNSAKGPKAWIFPILSGLTNRMAWGRIRRSLRKEKNIFLTSGALNHLGGLLSKARKERRHEIVYVENSFNWEKFQYCVKQDIPFLVMPVPKESFNPLQRQKKYFERNEAAYKSVDYSELFQGVFKKIFEQGVLAFAFDPEKLTALFETCKPEAVILDEDWAMRRTLSVLSRLEDRPCYVISHGVPGILFDENDKSLAGSYSSALTLVNGEFEKEQYENVFFDPDRLIVSGVPRYDEIVRLKAGTSSALPASAKKNILYCGAGMQGFDFEFVKPSLGLKIGQGESTRTYTEDLLDICGDKPALQLNIKPHYSQEAAWQAHILEHLRGRKSDHRLLSHQADTFALEAAADLVITVESSVICEAIMLDKPVIILNYSPQDLMTPYDRLGLAEQVKNKEQLEAAIQKCLFDQAYLQELSRRRKKYYEYYAGPMDGRNTERAMNVIFGASLDRSGTRKESKVADLARAHV